MRDEFVGYYPPTNAEYKALWDTGTIVLDTNVLLDLYRLPATARDEFISLLDDVKARIWIPHQVALEFQFRRLTVIAAERNATEKSLQEANSLYDDVTNSVTRLEIDKRGLGIETAPLLKAFEEAKDNLLRVIEKVHQAQLDIAVDDPIRDKVDTLFKGRIGPNPTCQQDVDDLCVQGDERYSKKIPPGFKDADKDKGEDAEFRFDGMVFPRKFGDLIIWRQIINFAKETKVERLLLITSDRKEDWWWREKGKTIGPRPELAREISRESDVRSFWMYSADLFLQNARTFTEAKISEESVSDVREVSRANALLRHGLQHGALASYSDFAVNALSRGALSPYKNEWAHEDHASEFAVFNHLRSRFDDISVNRGFPDFIATVGDERLGFEVKYLRNSERILINPRVVESMARGSIEVKEGRLDKFTLFIVIRYSAYQDIIDADEDAILAKNLSDLVVHYPLSNVIFATLDEEGSLSIVASFSSVRKN